MWLQQLFNNIAASGTSSKQQASSQRRPAKNFRKPNRKKNNKYHQAGSSAYQNAGFRKNRHHTSGRNGNLLIAFHGTTSASNAASVFRHGWMTGSGNAYGDGIYFTQDVSEAKSYAGSGGVYLKCSIRMGKTCNWDNAMAKSYDNWCKAGGIKPDNSAKTSFLLHKGFDTLKAGNIILVLEPQYSNPTAWKRRNHNIRILSVHRADSDQRIRV